MYSCDGKAGFSVYIIINFEKVVLLNIFVDFFSGFYSDKKDQKNSI